MTAEVVRPPEEILLGFARALRAAGLPVTQDRSAAFVTASSLVGLRDASGVYVAGRATLCAGPDDLERYDQVFHAWFGDAEGTPRVVPREQPRQVSSPLPLTDDSGSGGAEDEAETVDAAASEAEILRHRDVAALSADQKALLDAMIRALRPRPPRRRAARRTPWRRGDVDVRRTLRRSLRHLGEPVRIEHHRRHVRPRRVVLLVDVSASMRPYADALLRLCHVLVRTGAPVEAFTLGTRLTRITAALSTADPERALVRAGGEVPDWSGGTRLGETLQAFLDRWGARGMARGAVVVVLSDGWERGDAALLGEQMRRLRRLAHRVVWVNPHRGKAGYQPVQGGIVAALPHCDALVAGHSLRSFEQVLEVVGDA
ncbi:VWA domain-containing protein [Marmoricola endophyticus]|uniref:VWA domain-containing protein n=1 Tax=Marmoricola endophyticus TaxID=2040280 RepID=A0A917BQ17_9ACTN|nr:VWA domain-containing protein [Marmoricola endophyticus]GGF53446.1 VWA domain-containing protein [Marmoricola endophyticus]